MEILSPSNKVLDILDKANLFLAAGAKGVWLVNEQGIISIYDKKGERKDSKFVSDMENISIFH